MPKVALGKGLGALIKNKPTTSVVPADGEAIQKIALAQIVPTPLQPRTQFRPEGLEELINSIRERGIIQPLIVRKVKKKYELIAGERRWRAATEIGLTEAPVIVREASDLEVLELALIENLQREDLNPIEEAQAYARLAKEFDLKQEEISHKVGKSRATIANSMRLLDLHAEVQSWVSQGLLSVGHGKVLLSVKNKAEQKLLAEAILRQGATVRAAEQLISKHLDLQDPNRQPRSRTAAGKTALAPALHHLQNRLREHLATHVTMKHGAKKGRLEIEYYGHEDLERILALLGLPQDEF